MRQHAGSGGQGFGLRAVTEEESALLKSLSDKNAGFLVHIKVSPPQFMQNLGTCGVKQPRRLTEEDLLTRHDIIKHGETFGQLAKHRCFQKHVVLRFPFFY